MCRCSPPKTINQLDLPFESPANIKRRLYGEHYRVGTTGCGRLATYALGITGEFTVSPQCCPPRLAALKQFIVRHGCAVGCKMRLVKLNDVRRIAMSLPEVTEEPHFAYTSFRVKGKIFATAPPDGDHLHIFVADEDREPALVMAPGAIEKLWWGGKVRGLRVALPKAKMLLVAELLKKAWLR